MLMNAVDLRLLMLWGLSCNRDVSHPNYLVLLVAQCDLLWINELLWVVFGVSIIFLLLQHLNVG